MVSFARFFEASNQLVQAGNLNVLILSRITHSVRTQWFKLFEIAGVVSTRATFFLVWQCDDSTKANSCPRVFCAEYKQHPPLASTCQELRSYNIDCREPWGDSIWGQMYLSSRLSPTWKIATDRIATDEGNSWIPISSQSSVLVFIHIYNWWRLLMRG